MATAAERFQKKGRIARISEEYFNRDKGTEWFFLPLDIEGSRTVIGYIGGYPDACPSDFEGEYYALNYADFCTIWDTCPDRRIWRIGAALKAAGAEVLSHERYQAILQSGSEVPRCEHCTQTIL